MSASVMQKNAGEEVPDADGDHGPRQEATGRKHA